MRWPIISETTFKLADMTVTVALAAAMRGAASSPWGREVVAGVAGVAMFLAY